VLVLFHDNCMEGPSLHLFLTTVLQDLSIIYLLLLASVMSLLAWVFRPCGPTQGSPPCSFSPSLVGMVAHVPKLISSPKCLASEVVECSVLSGRIARVLVNSADWKQVNASCKFGIDVWNNWPCAKNNWSSP
jgi:hypothetical protein